MFGIVLLRLEFIIPMRKRLILELVGYPDHSKGYKFYCPTRGTRIVESMTAKFLEFDVVDVDYSPQPVEDVQNKIVSFFVF